MAILLSSCANDDDKSDINASDFCNRERELVTEIDEQGILIYLQTKNKYAIRMHIDGTIDEVNYYVICEKPTGIDINNNIDFAGKVYSFNEDENFQANIAGEMFYYLKLNHSALKVQRFINTGD